ncbi:MAG: L,D-transpeptidase [Candidatus Dojkabacteria bacterium]|nr:L,D-transpeptidase [Candidatus Dojkabacteria bacterium]
MKNKGFFIVFLLSFLLFFISFTVYKVIDNKDIFIKSSSNPVDESTVLGDTVYIPPEIVEESIKYPSVNVCYKDNCYYILPEIIESFYIDDQLNTNSLYMYLLENVVGYFEKLSGGKVLVENSKGSFYTWEEDSRIDTSNIYKGIEKLLLNRDTDVYELRYELYKKDLPGTDGKYSNRYIEVDNSKQKLYAWYDGEVIKIINLSAAQEGFEVYGVFPIIDKGIQPMAPSGHYMPYWMAFYYSPWQHSWYGLHGLVWWYDDNGNKVFENTDYIGVRRSKGCIRMLKDDAKYLYDRYEKGDHILIHE